MLRLEYEPKATLTENYACDKMIAENTQKLEVCNAKLFLIAETGEICTKDPP